MDRPKRWLPPSIQEKKNEEREFHKPTLRRVSDAGGAFVSDPSVRRRGCAAIILAVLIFWALIVWLL